MANEMKISKNKSVHAKTIEGKLFLMDLDSASCLELNEVGAFIWESLSQTQRPDELVEKIAATFTVEPSQAKKDISRFLKELNRHGLIFF